MQSPSGFFSIYKKEVHRKKSFSCNAPLFFTLNDTIIYIFILFY